MKNIKLLFLILVFTGASKSAYASIGDTLSASPNPFDSVTVIHFGVTANDTVWLSVFNLLGHTIKTYFDATILPSGSYSLNFNGDTLPNGGYLVHLKINQLTYNIKIVKQGSELDVKQNSDLKLDILLYPNPTNDLLEIPIDGMKRIMVTDLNGRILIDQTTETKSISLSDLSAGNYIVSVFSQKNQFIMEQQINKID